MDNTVNGTMDRSDHDPSARVHSFLFQNYYEGDFIAHTMHQNNMYSLVGKKSSGEEAQEEHIDSTMYPFNESKHELHYIAALPYKMVGAQQHDAVTKHLLDYDHMAIVPAHYHMAGISYPPNPSHSNANQLDLAAPAPNQTSLPVICTRIVTDDLLHNSAWPSFLAINVIECFGLQYLVCLVFGCRIQINTCTQLPETLPIIPTDPNRQTSTASCTLVLNCHAGRKPMVN